MNTRELSSQQTAWMLASVLVVALCGIAYELIIAAVSSYLLGNSVAQFSITIGLFMFSMGIGSYLSKFINQDLVLRFVQIEITVALIGGFSAMILFLVFPYYALYQPTMYSLTLVIGTLVGLEIPILTRILTESRSISDSIAHVLSLDYIGALIGSVSFPLLLLPSLGLFRSSFAIGLLNISVAALALVVLRKPFPELRSYWPATIFIIALLFGGIFYSSAISKFAEGQLFADEMIFQEQTTYQRIVVTKHPRNGEVRLYLDGHLQFAQSDEHRYHESLVHPVMSCGSLPRRVLILGGGDGLAIREVLKYSTVESIDLVDIDPRMTELSKSFGPIVRMNQNSLDDPKVTIYHEDAFNFVQKAYLRLSEENRFYDRIIIDLPDPHSEVLNKLYSKEFYGLIARVLSDDGSLITQSASPVVTREAFWCINKTIESADFRVLPFRGFLNSFGEWGFNLAVKKPSSVKLDSIVLTDVPRKHLSTDAFRVASQFAMDDGPLAVPINTLFEPKLYMLYEMGLKQ
ncbi:MAG: polyamine aminopropyltransferase [Pirellula sp.]|jgi:spermidine synthase